MSYSLHGFTKNKNAAWFENFVIRKTMYSWVDGFTNHEILNQSALTFFRETMGAELNCSDQLN